jgi:hypothetical protein
MRFKKECHKLLAGTWRTQEFFYIYFKRKQNKLAIMTIAQCSSCYFIKAKHSLTLLYIQIKGFIFIIYKYCTNSFLTILYVNVLSLFLLIVGKKKLHNILFHQYLVIGFLSVKLHSMVWQNHRWYAVTGYNLQNTRPQKNTSRSVMSAQR